MTLEFGSAVWKQFSWLAGLWCMTEWNMAGILFIFHVHTFQHATSCKYCDASFQSGAKLILTSRKRSSSCCTFTASANAATSKTCTYAPRWCSKMFFLFDFYFFTLHVLKFMFVDFAFVRQWFLVLWQWWWLIDNSFLQVGVMPLIIARQYITAGLLS